MSYLLDTNAVIALLKGDQAFRARITARQPSEFTLSSIVLHELYYGAFKSARVEHNLERVRALPFEILALTPEDAIEAGKIRAGLAAAGTPIGPYDVLIAGQAVCRKLTLISRKVREFDRVEGLTVEDWSA